MITEQTIREFGRALELPSFYRLEHEKLRKHLDNWHFSDRICQATSTGLIEEPPRALSQPTDPVVTRATQLLKQGRIFIRMGMKAQDEVKPILLYYGMSQVWGFFVASLVDYRVPSRRHGLVMIDETHISMKEKGAFTRLVDLLAILGTESEYSRILWNSGANNFSASSSQRRYKFTIPLETLHEYFDEHLLTTTAPHQTILLDEDCYMLNFVASHLARYRPEIWRRIVDGQGDDTSMIHFRTAFERVPRTYKKVVATFMGTARGTSPKNTLLIYEDMRTHGLAFPLSDRL